MFFLFRLQKGRFPVSNCLFGNQYLCFSNTLLELEEPRTPSQIYLQTFFLSLAKVLPLMEMRQPRCLSIAAPDPSHASTPACKHVKIRPVSYRDLAFSVKSRKFLKIPKPRWWRFARRWWIFARRTNALNLYLGLENFRWESESFRERKIGKHSRKHQQQQWQQGEAKQRTNPWTERGAGIQLILINGIWQLFVAWIVSVFSFLLERRHD